MNPDNTSVLDLRTILEASESEQHLRERQSADLEEHGFTADAEAVVQNGSQVGPADRDNRRVGNTDNTDGNASNQADRDSLLPADEDGSLSAFPILASTVDDDFSDNSFLSMVDTESDGGDDTIAGRHGNKNNRWRKNQQQRHNDQDISPSTSASPSLQRASHRIQGSKILVFVVLLVAAGCTSYIVYRIYRQQEQDTYKVRFQDISTSVFAVAEINARAVVDTYEVTSRQITAHSTPSITSKAPEQAGWPFVTIPHFQALVDQVIKVTDTTSFSVNTFVSKDQFYLYQQYRSQNMGWVQEGMEYLGKPNHEVFLIPVVYDNINMTTGELDITTLDSVGDEGFAIISQIAPVDTLGFLANFNSFADPPSKILLQVVRASQRTVFSYVVNPDAEPGEGNAWPASFMATPVFDKLDRTVHASTDEPETNNTTAKLDRQVVAVLTGSVNWEGHFRNLIPDSIDEIYLVLRNTCNQSFTYLIDGPDVHYLGNSDIAIDEQLRDNELGSHPRFDLEESHVFRAFASLDVCRYTLHLYPSQNFYDSYHTNRPTHSALIMIATFLGTALAFLVYDFFVEQRQSFVMSAANKSEAIISSLFPANVRDRLLNDSSTRSSSGDDNDDDALPKSPGWFMSKNQQGRMARKKTQTNTSTKQQKSQLLYYHPHETNASPGVGGSYGSAGTVGGTNKTSSRKGSGWLSSMSRPRHHTPAIKDAEPLNQINGLCIKRSKPIADLFPNATVMFADIVGFTAWSSMREPAQVFTLLETLYSSFDGIARRMAVFKVETIGDCYVAAAGLPDPTPDHAVLIAKFAQLCLVKMLSVLRRLTVLLGPNTRDLLLRVGIHSGPVTAGVLRGERSRFQLFGDTVNTASRMESTSMAQKIQISQETADELANAGKASWFIPRREKVTAKGKGELQTYWLLQKTSNTASDASSRISYGRPNCRRRTKQQRQALLPADTLHGILGGARSTGRTAHGKTLAEAAIRKVSSRYSPSRPEQDRGTGRSDDAHVRSDNAQQSPEAPASLDMELEIQWNVDVLQTMIKKIVAKRDPNKRVNKDALHSLSVTKEMTGATVLDEVKEVIELPNKAVQDYVKPDNIVLSPVVVEQIDDYVRQIAAMYRSNPFHNFSHAAHVVQSTIKLLSRVAGSESIDYADMCYKEKSGEVLHKYTYGITSDPITQFACVLAAMIHDVDHTGVPNSQLVKEKTRIAVTYRNKSVAEQNSLDLAWDLLMDPSYAEFRACIYSTQAELDRFRQLLVNAVLATDIMDKELGSLRKLRWATAFDRRQNQGATDDQSALAPPIFSTVEDSNRMATIVIEHLIQASDVSHTMQHWHVYIKWNECLFHEMYRAYLEGRAEKDPSENWYRGEMGFFDFYVIPLAKKLKECGVFGVSSDEYLNYAITNRKEWEIRGKEVVAGYLALYD